MINDPLLSISPIDGRYHKDTEVINKYFSEYAYIRYRLLVEIKYLLFLSLHKIIRDFTKKEIQLLNDYINNFDLKSANEVKEFEFQTNHDVKAIEYFIKAKIKNTSLIDVSEFIHFGLTSEDVNNIALRLMLKDLNEHIIQPTIQDLNNILLKNFEDYKKLPMLARTHGQPAVPTTLGKEFQVFANRLNIEINLLENFNFRSKLNGAVGNFSALHFAYPNINWVKLSNEFLKTLSLENAKVTTQIAPYEDIIYFFQIIQRINGIVIDLDQDMWRYISDGYFTQENKKNEIGSSTMPQKINPIAFENSEGNLFIANSLIEGFTAKLPLSRLQRDLSGSTISRNFGMTLAYSLIAYKNTLKGLNKIKANKDIIIEKLNSDFSILSEAMQIYLKKEGIKNGYELTKQLTRGLKIDKTEWHKMIDSLPLNETQKTELKKLTPENYLGII